MRGRAGGAHYFSTLPPAPAVSVCLPCGPLLLLWCPCLQGMTRTLSVVSASGTPCWAAAAHHQSQPAQRWHAWWCSSTSTAPACGAYCQYRSGGGRTCSLLTMQHHWWPWRAGAAARSVAQALSGSRHSMRVTVCLRFWQQVAIQHVVLLLSRPCCVVADSLLPEQGDCWAARCSA